MKSPDQIDANMERALQAARSLLARGQHAEAEAVYQDLRSLISEAIREAPHLIPEWTWYLGMVFADTGNVLKAIDAFGICLAADPRHKGAREQVNLLMGRLIEDRLRELRVAAGRTEEPAAGKAERSVIFFNNSYYNFSTLAPALRQRGWDALTVSFEDPAGRDRFVYYGEDLNIFSPDWQAINIRVEGLVACIPQMFRLFYSYGRNMVHYPGLWTEEDETVLRLKAEGVKFGWTPTGCCDGTRQSVFRKWSRHACDHCAHQNDPNICSDALNTAMARRFVGNADLVEAGPYALDYVVGPTCVHLPLTICIDPELWCPDLEVPDEHRIERREEELLVFHSFANAQSRTRSEGDRNIKGTPSLLSAISRLSDEGYPIRLIAVPPNLENLTVRYYMAQADVIVDQIVHGRLGAAGREGLMLGKPVVSWINCDLPLPPSPFKPSEFPVASAYLDEVEQVLRDLYEAPEKRKELGRKARVFGLEWLTPERCAERFEAAYDRIMAGEDLHPQEDWAVLLPRA